MKTKRFMNIRTFNTIVSAVALRGLGASCTTTQAARDPLPSWNDGPAKQAIVDFVRATPSRVVRSSWRRQSASLPSTTTARSGASSRCIFNSSLRSSNSYSGMKSTARILRPRTGRDQRGASAHCPRSLSRP